jgi:hypothetical protein
VRKVDLYASFKERLTGLARQSAISARQSDISGSLADPKQVRMADFEPLAVAHDDTKWFEWLLAKVISELDWVHAIS